MLSVVFPRERVIVGVWSNVLVAVGAVVYSVIVCRRSNCSRVATACKLKLYVVGALLKREIRRYV